MPPLFSCGAASFSHCSGVLAIATIVPDNLWFVDTRVPMSDTICDRALIDRQDSPSFRRMRGARIRRGLRVHPADPRKSNDCRTNFFAFGIGDLGELGLVVFPVSGGRGGGSI